MAGKARSNGMVFCKKENIRKSSSLLALLIYMLINIQFGLISQSKIVKNDTVCVRYQLLAPASLSALVTALIRC